MCVGERIRQTIACLCFIAVAGPVLIIVGCLSLTAQGTSRDSGIAAWKTAIATFDASVLPSLRGTTATLGGVNMALVKSMVTVQGNQESVPQGVSSIALTTNAAPANSWSFLTSINGSVASNVTSAWMEMDEFVKTSVYCTYAYCTSNCAGSASNYYCESINSHACGDGLFSGTDSCYGDDGKCGTCNRYVYLSSVCVPMALTGGEGAAKSWRQSPTKLSCTYPFKSAQQYADTDVPSSIPVKLMSDQDPYITLSEITLGTNDLGTTVAEQHTMGSKLLVIGIVFSVVVYGAIGVLVYRLCCRSPQQDRAGDAAYVIMPPQQPVAYGQPAYGQPVYNGKPEYSEPMQMQQVEVTLKDVV